MLKKIGSVAAVTVIIIVLFFFLKAVFSGALILPQLLHVGPFGLRWYGIMMALAAGAGYWLAVRRAPRFGLRLEDADALLFAALICGFIGARLYHVASELGFYWHNPVFIVQVWKGGLGIFGAVAGGVLGLYLAKRYKGLPLSLLRLLDWLVPSVVAGQIIGRFGNMFNYELFGYSTNLPWKMFVPWAQNFFHPLFLYEQICNLAILILLLAVERRAAAAGRTLPSGALFFVYVLLYTIVRFFLEFLRLDSVFIYGFRQNAIVSAGLAVMAAIYLYKLKFKIKY